MLLNLEMGSQLWFRKSTLAYWYHHFLILRHGTIIHITAPHKHCFAPEKSAKIYVQIRTVYIVWVQYIVWIHIVYTYNNSILIVDGGNPAPPKGWLKAYKEWDVYHLSTGAGFPPSTSILAGVWRHQCQTPGFAARFRWGKHQIVLGPNWLNYACLFNIASSLLVYYVAIYYHCCC